MFNDKSLLLRVFLVYVRPILEYCSVVWSPCTRKDIDCIEKVQQQFTKRLPGLKSVIQAYRSFKMPWSYETQYIHQWTAILSHFVPEMWKLTTGHGYMGHYIHARWSIFTFPGQNEPRPEHGTLWVNSGTIPAIPGRLASLTVRTMHSIARQKCGCRKTVVGWSTTTSRSGERSSSL